MKAIRLFVPLLVLFLGLINNEVRAQADVTSGPITLSQSDLQDLVAPIALYPDPLIALILPASTVPTDIVLAERFLTNGGDADDIDDQSWDDNVKGLARYPEVIEMMSENLDWTNQLGAAVLYQQNDVMAAIQAQRAKAKALGNLTTTPQQQVSVDDGDIQIYPANPEVIYVPVYNPTVVYLQPAPPVPFITFGSGFSVGIWLGGGCDWRSNRIYSRGYYRPGYGWGPGRPGYRPGPVWRPNPARPKPRPPYRPGRPGSHLPGFRPPPNQGRPPGGNRPGLPGRPKPGPDYGGSKPGHGTRPNPGFKPPGGRPNQPGRPETKPAPVKPPIAKPDRPAIKPAPVRPAPKPQQPAVRPAPIKPAPKPERPVVKPAPAKPRPQPERPVARPMPAPHPAASRPATNPKHSQARPAQVRPQPRPAAPAKGQNRGQR